MKISHFLFCALLGAFFTLVSCNSKKEEPVSTDQTTLLSPDQGAAALSTEPPMTEGDAALSGEFHFKCPKGCEGGGASAKGKCPVCGTELEHNQAFHAQVTTTPGSSPTSPITINPTSGTSPLTAPGTTAGATPPTTKPVEPPQNASGVWHYVCSKTCGGTGGAQGACPKCGAALAHNAEYHK